MSLWSLLNLNKEGKVERDELMKSTLGLMRFHLLYPPKNQEMKPKKWYWIRFSLALTSGLAYFICSVLTAYHYFTYDAWNSFKEYLAYVTSFVGCFYFYILGSASSKMIHTTLTKLHDFSEFGEPEDLKTASWFLNHFCVMQYSYVTMLIFVHGFLSLLHRTDCEEKARAFDWPLTCSYIDVIPLVVTHLGSKIILFVWLMANSFYFPQGAALCAYIFFEANQYLATKLRHLGQKFEGMFDDKFENRYREQFRHCVRYHAHILFVAGQLNDCFKEILLAHIFLSGAIFGLLANLILEMHSLANAMHLVAWMLVGFIACLAGQQTIDESEKLAEAIYNSRWYEMDISLQKDVLVVLCLTQRPITMQAGPFGILSYPLWISIVKTAYSYMTLVQTT